MQVSPSSGAPAENGAPIGPQPGQQAGTQQSPAAGQQPQETSSPQPQPQPQPQDEGAAMLRRIAAVHADVDGLAARVSSLNTFGRGRRMCRYSRDS